MKQRSTRQRRLVFEAVQAMRDHPTADQIYRKVCRDDPHISRGTVYRNLNLLAENGEIRRVRLPGVERFDWRTERHDHVVCTRCARIVDAPAPYEQGTDSAVAKATGFEIWGHVKLFEGLCPACREGGGTLGGAAPTSPCQRD